MVTRHASALRHRAFFFLQRCNFYGSAALPPLFLAAGVWWWLRYPFAPLPAALLGTAALLLAWARFVEPHLLLRTRHARIPAGFSGAVALVADLHVGVFKGVRFMRRLVRRVNALEGIEALLIAGDFTYLPHRSLRELCAPLREVRVPVYAVLGNHDLERPGPPVRAALLDALREAGVRVVEGKTVAHDHWVLAGVGDHLAGEDDLSVLVRARAHEKPVVALLHNPDSTLRYSTRVRAEVTLAGHTHGGQIRLPLLYRAVIPTRGAFDRGLVALRYTTLYITSGLGEVGLPLRLFNPPVVERVEFLE